MERPRRRSGSCTVLIALLLLAPVGALAQEAEAPEVDERSALQRVWDTGFDVVLLRPTGLVVLVAGAGLFVPAVTLSSPGGREPMRQALDTFVLKPGKFALTRPLGEF